MRSLIATQNPLDKPQMRHTHRHLYQLRSEQLAPHDLQLNRTVVIGNQ
jgi:hypothetical protein